MLVGFDLPPQHLGGERIKREASHDSRRCRVNLDPFDIAVNGYSEGGGEPAAGAIADYEAAGLTWWLERIDTDRLFSFDQAKQRVHAGPPNGGEDDNSPSKKGTS